MTLPLTLSRFSCVDGFSALLKRYLHLSEREVKRTYLPRPVRDPDPRGPVGTDSEDTPFPEVLYRCEKRVIYC